MNNRKRRWTGLGLYIVKEIVDKLNGFVTLTSVQGQGTEVILDLPQHR
ncbi:MAG: ATP-binding protein [Bacteroidetes bacterium]|nr:ATP-binding protein [Bacteroidota bacterium]MDA0903281.1 ATP-binding protein [Bacteroidota bacterium]MDA1242160.1 ATP-binding protein [Bacteroidota bacterium]